MRAGWCEGAGDGEKDGLFAGGEGRDGGGLEFSGGVEVRESGVRELVTESNGGGDGRGFGCFGGERESERLREVAGEGMFERVREEGDGFRREEREFG